MGNIAQNSRAQNFSGKLDLVKLYNKIGFLKNINTPKPPPRPLPKDPKERAKLAKADTLPHPPELKLIKTLMRMVMSVRSINGTYAITEGTVLPGFTQSPKLLGLDQTWKAPGVGFVLGQQDPNIMRHAANNGWITTNKNLTTPFSQNQTKTLNLSASVEPATDVKIQLTASKTANTSFQELFKYAYDSAMSSFRFQDLSPSRSGSYRISFLSVGTSFMSGEDLFNQFIKNQGILSRRFNAITSKTYENQSQDVLIPAFIAAYSGHSANTVSFSPFPRIPLPNWRLDYNGLTKLAPFKDIFSSVSINHAYSSSYTVSNYSNSLLYNSSNNFDVSQLQINHAVENYNSTRGFFASQYSRTDTTNHLVPIYVINQVLISETFAPLIGVTVKTKSKMNLSFKYNTKRDISLNVSNAQITEMTGKDWQLEVGYTKSNMRLPIRDQGRIITLKNDVTFRMTMGVTSTQTVQRRIDEGSTVTNGNINFQLRPNISYVANKKLTLQVYLERTVNHPLISSAYPRFNTKGGFKVIFNLSQ
jgi:cell surface protein SprA